MAKQNKQKDAFLEEMTIDENGLPVLCLTHIEHVEATCFNEFHYHNYIELIYVIEGTRTAIVSGVPHKLSAGDLVLINSGYVHNFICDPGSILCLRFDPEIIYNSQKNAAGLKYILPIILEGNKNSTVFRKQELEDSGIPELLLKIHSDNMQKPYGYEFSTQIMVNEIYLWFLRFWHSQNSRLSFTPSAAEQSATWLNKVFTYVADNYSQPVTSQEMAELCHMSYSYFSRSFKRIMKKSFTEYLNYVRVTEAEKLLLTTDMNITEIAMQVGFSTSSYFIQQFKNIKAVSPKQYKLNFEA